MCMQAIALLPAGIDSDTRSKGIVRPTLYGWNVESMSIMDYVE